MQTAINSFMEPLPGAEDGIPEWVHLLPTGTFSGVDGRGPFELGDPAELIAASLKSGRKLPIDINHATDLIAKDGKATPAVGWIVALEGRQDGIWGRVEWNGRGREALAGRDYGYLSPVFTHPKTKPFRIAQLLRAALTNDPNLTLTSLHHRKHEDDHMEKAMREALGLPETASSEEILQAAKDRVSELKQATAAMARIAKAAGLPETAAETEIVTALNTRKAGKADDAEIKALEQQITALNSRLTEVTTHSARKDAEAAINLAIEEGKIVPALRDRYIARHMADPADVDGEIKLMPSINSGGIRRHLGAGAEGEQTLSGPDAEVAELMGLDPKKFAETAKHQKEAL